MTDERMTTPESEAQDRPASETPANGVNPSPSSPPNAAQAAPPNSPPSRPPEPPRDGPEDEMFEERLERLGGEPAPVITPEEFARLQRAGQVHIDARGRVRTARRSDAEAGVSLRKRRAWYAR